MPEGEKREFGNTRIAPKLVVGIFDHTATLGGGEIALLNLVRQLDRERFEPLVILGTDGPLVERLEASGIRVEILPMAPSVLHTRKDSLGMGSVTRVRDILRMVRYATVMAKYLRARGIELLHTNSLKADILGGLAARMAGIPVIWHVRDRIEKDYLPAPVVSIFRKLCRLIPNYVVTNSQATLETLRLAPTQGTVSGTYIHTRPSGFQKARVVYDGTPIPHSVPIVISSSKTAPSAEVITEQTASQDDGVAKDHMEPSDSAQPVFNQQIETQETERRIIIGLVGRISPWKGQHIFLEAASQVNRRYPHVEYQIIGAALFSESDYEEEIHHLTERLGLADRVNFMGFCDDVMERIKALDILVHASTVGEPFGQVIVEGMACAKPVVATRGGGVPEIVEDGVSGILVPMSDANGMAEAILRLIERPDVAREMGERAYLRVSEYFSIDLTARRMEEVYQDVRATRP